MSQTTVKSVPLDLASALKEVKDGCPVVIRRRGRPVGALVSMKDLRLLEKHIEEIEDRVDREEIAKAKAEIEREGTIPWEQVKKELGLSGE